MLNHSTLFSIPSEATSSGSFSNNSNIAKLTSISGKSFKSTLLSDTILSSVWAEMDLGGKIKEKANDKQIKLTKIEKVFFLILHYSYSLIL
ncbi:hypothetical protein PSEUDO8BK_130001 [Pseudomonas sp. 8BK]|nr:hypothetical protein PSEUDO8BK_130001 [Pseudomonas sp. 8BK]